MTEPARPQSEPTPEPAGAAHEPSVLDWFKSLLRGRPLPIPEGPAPAWVPEPAPPMTEARSAGRPGLLLQAASFRLPVALFLALLAQGGLERRSGPPLAWAALYLVAACLIGWAFWARDFEVGMPGASSNLAGALSIRPWYLAAALILGLLTFITSSDNRFRTSTVIAWGGSLILGMLALWDGTLNPRAAWRAIYAWLVSPRLRIYLSAWGLALLAVIGVTLYFRFAQLNRIPIEMVSDHAEKLLDVIDVQRGEHAIFFPRNTGREALQFYLAAATASLLGTGISFLTLKLGTALAGWVTLPFIYLFGVELGGRKTGLLALLLAGVAYWPNVISRVGLRFPLYPLFVAPAMFFLVRGIRRRSRNDFLWCGLIIGLGQHGYSPTRVLPLVILAGLVLFLMHREARGQRRAMLSWTMAAGFIMLLALMPLMRVSVEMPDQVLFRALTRIGESERELPGSPLVLFLGNTWNALRMFGWDNGEVWVNSIPHRPALDWITAAFFHLGVAVALIRYIRRRTWLDLFTLLSIPILLLPSIMALAFPAENPAPNRAAGAMVPVFALAALSWAGLLDWIQNRVGRPSVRRIWYAAVGTLLALTLVLNYRLVFVEYEALFRRSAWNTGQMGQVIRGFADSVGSYDTSHVVAYPHWVDTRLVAMHAGVPTVDYAIWPPDLGALVDETRPQLFLVNSQDNEGLETLLALFPQGSLTHVVPPEEGHDFYVFQVPGRPGLGPNPPAIPEP
jgi:hypothetical protein